MPRRSGNALPEEAWANIAPPEVVEKPRAATSSCEPVADRLLREFREHQTRHEHRVLELLEAHQKRLEKTFGQLPPSSGARGPNPLAPAGFSLTQPPAAGHAVEIATFPSPKPNVATAAAPPQPYWGSRRHSTPAAQGDWRSPSVSAAAAAMPPKHYLAFPRQSTASAPVTQSELPISSYAVGAPPPKPDPGLRRFSTASAPVMQSELDCATSAPGDRRLSEASGNPKRLFFTKEELTSAVDRALSLDSGKTIPGAVEETETQVEEAPNPAASTVLLRQSSRTETWSNDEAVEATELYKKKKVVDELSRRFSSREDKRTSEGSCSKRALALISHPRFELILAIIICLNAVSIGLQADWAVRNVSAQTPLPMKVADYTFTVIFTIELVLRIAGEGTAFLSVKNKNLPWNVFDSFLVGTAVAEDLVAMLLSFGANVSVIRLLRVLRLARVVRLFRVLRFFKDLRVMIVGITKSGKPLMWASLLLLLIIYMYAICILQVVGDQLDSLKREGSDGTHADSLAEFYGSLPMTVYTLFGAICGGHDWGVVEPLLQIHPVMGLANVVYVIFAVFCVLNVITGVFVENAFKINNDDDDKVVLDMLESRKQWIHEIKDLFKLADKSNTGLIDWAEFRAVITDVRVQAVFSRLGLDIEEDSAASLFELLDFGGTGLISLDDFAEGVQRVRGSARSIDICQLLHDNRVLKGQLSDMMRSVDMLLCWQQGGGKMHAAADEVCALRRTNSWP